MDSNENYVLVSLPVEYWKHLCALLDFEFCNTSKALMLAREMKNEKLISLYENKVEFLSFCIYEINKSLSNGNKDL